MEILKKMLLASVMLACVASLEAAVITNNTQQIFIVVAMIKGSGPGGYDKAYDLIIPAGTQSVALTAVSKADGTSVMPDRVVVWTAAPATASTPADKTRITYNGVAYIKDKMVPAGFCNNLGVNDPVTIGVDAAGKVVVTFPAAAYASTNAGRVNG